MNMTGRARALRRQSTPAERKVWLWLRRHHLDGYKFRRQHPVDRYVLDFYCAELKLCIELDGYVHNTDPGAIRDAARTVELSKRGITVLRFWNDDVRKYPDQCWEKIVEAVESLATDPSP